MIEQSIDLNYLKIYYDTVCDGQGIRVSIYLAGCKHNCYMCHNPLSHDENSGEKLTYEILKDVKQYLTKNQYIDGITISGGEPFFKPNELIKILRYFKDYNIWCYSGFKYEYLIKNHKQCFEYIDILVDGKFIYDLYDPSLKFRGSSNQKIIEIKKLT